MKIIRPSIVYLTSLYSLQSANPYVVKLSILDDELALTVSTDVSAVERW